MNDPEANTDKKVARLKPWLYNAKQNITHSQSILRELERVKVLDVAREKMYKNRNELITQKQLKDFEELLKPKARFIKNDYTGTMPHQKV